MCWDDEDVEPFEGGVRSIQSSFFCNICVEEILAGNRSLGTLNARGYINLGQFFFSNMETIYPKSVLLENHFGPILV